MSSPDLVDLARTSRTNQFRYTYYPRGGEQLFDLRKDCDEQHNLVAEPEYAEVRVPLRGRLMKLIARQDCPKTRRLVLSMGVH